MCFNPSYFFETKDLWIAVDALKILTTEEAYVNVLI